MAFFAYLHPASAFWTWGRPRWRRPWFKRGVWSGQWLSSLLGVTSSRIRAIRGVLASNPGHFGSFESGFSLWFLQRALRAIGRREANGESQNFGPGFRGQHRVIRARSLHKNSQSVRDGHTFFSALFTWVRDFFEIFAAKIAPGSYALAVGARVRNLNRSNPGQIRQNPGRIRAYSAGRGLLFNHSAMAPGCWSGPSGVWSRFSSWAWDATSGCDDGKYGVPTMTLSERAIDRRRRTTATPTAETGKLKFSHTNSRCRSKVETYKTLKTYFFKNNSNIKYFKHNEIRKF